MPLVPPPPDANAAPCALLAPNLTRVATSNVERRMARTNALRRLALLCLIGTLGSSRAQPMLGQRKAPAAEKCLDYCHDRQPEVERAMKTACSRRTLTGAAVHSCMTGFTAGWATICEPLCEGSVDCLAKSHLDRFLATRDAACGRTAPCHKGWQAGGGAALGFFDGECAPLEDPAEAGPALQAAAAQAWAIAKAQAPQPAAKADLSKVAWSVEAGPTAASLPDPARVTAVYRIHGEDGRQLPHKLFVREAPFAQAVEYCSTHFAGDPGCPRALFTAATRPELGEKRFQLVAEAYVP